MKLNTRWIICFCLLLPFFEPQYFKTIPLINKGYQLAVYLVAIWIIFEYFRKRRMPSKIVLALAGLEVWTLLITLLSGGIVNTAVQNLINFVTIAAVLDLYSHNVKQLVQCLMLHFEICIYINAFTLFVMPNGIYTIINSVYGVSPGYFLGWHHLFVVWFFPGLLTAWLYKEITKKSLRCYFLSLIIILSELKFGGSTGIAGCVLFLLPNILPHIKTIIKKYLPPARGVIITVAIIISIVYFRIYDYLEPLIVGVLGGDMTFTGRLEIWDNAIKAIAAKPLQGYGIITQSVAVKTFGFTAATHCHNQLLHVIYQSGLVGLCFYAVIYVINISCCKRMWHDTCAQTCIWGIIVYTVLGITEQREYALMYLALILPYYIVHQRAKKRSSRNFLGGQL